MLESSVTHDDLTAHKGACFLSNSKFEPCVEAGRALHHNRLLQFALQRGHQGPHSISDLRAQCKANIFSSLTRSIEAEHLPHHGHALLIIIVRQFFYWFFLHLFMFAVYFAVLTMTLLLLCVLCSCRCARWSLMKQEAQTALETTSCRWELRTLLACRWVTFAGIGSF